MYLRTSKTLRLPHNCYNLYYMPRFVALPVLLDQIRSTKDKALKITFISPELPPDQASVILALANAQGYAYFAPNALQEADLVMPENDDLPQEKTPSKRLRSVLFVLWKQRGEQGDFRTFYEQQVERFIEAVKEKLT